LFKNKILLQQKQVSEGLSASQMDREISSARSTGLPLFEIIEDRHGVGSTVITAQLPIEHWHEYLGGGMLGDGICDRLLHNCHKLKLQGETYRKTASDLTQGATLAKRN